MLFTDSADGAVRPEGDMLPQWGGIRARDIWFMGKAPVETPDYESGAQARLGYPGFYILGLFD
ncbi:MAG TPA: hypothetical protein VEH86_02670 [Candidatus Acidoferrum sp.]|nr:hypothetical protein [Candidatus Acidoferrum sp.]